MLDNPLHLLLLALATYRGTRFLIEDRLFDAPRNAIWRKFPPESTKTGYLFTCYWCASVWVAAVMIVCYLIVQPVALVIVTILALSAVAGLIQTQLDK